MLPCFAQHFQSLYSLLTYLRVTLCCFGLLRSSSRSAVVVNLSLSQSLLLWFGLCLGPRVVLLILDLSLSQSFFLCFAQHLKLICSLLTCLNSRHSLFQPFVLCVETSTRSTCCSVVSGGYLNTLTFVGLVLVNSCFIHPSF